MARELQVSPGTLANWRSQGYGPAFFKIGRAVRYGRDELTAWLRERRASSTRS